MITWEDCIGWFDWQDLYQEAAYTAQPGSTLVEVGVAFGRSLLYLAEQVKKIGREGVRVAAVDPWVPYDEHHFIYQPYEGMHPYERQAYECAQKHGGVYEAFRYNLAESGLEDVVDVYRVPSVTGAALVPGNIHFVFIDGSHHYEDVKADLAAWWARGPEWMAGHDFNPKSELHFPGVWKAVYDKWPEAKIEWRGSTCWVARRSIVESSDPAGDAARLAWVQARWLK